MNGLLGTTSAEQYYTKSQQFTTTSTQASNDEYTLTVSNLPASEADFMVFVNGTEINPSTYTYNSSTGVIDITSNLPVLNDTVLVEFLDRELGDYRYISFQNLVNNFVMGYVGNGKLIGHADRSEIIFHIKRGIQEFSYDVSRVEKIQEVEVPPSLTIPMPQDYVSYVGIHWIDDNGAEHPVFPARFTSRPSESVAQADNGDYLFDEAGGVLTLNPSVTENRFDSFNQDVFTGSQQNDDYFLLTI